MARYYGYKGFGWTRTGGVRAALLGALLLVACTHKPIPIGPWAYEFQLGTFKDNRPQNDDVMMRNSEPFTLDAFMQGWRNSVSRSVFASRPAKLDIVLHHYEVTSGGSSYAINMDVTLSGRGEYGQPLGTMNARCDAIERITTRTLWDFGQQAGRQGSIHPLTAAARNATLWQKVMDSCVAELAKQFDTTLAAHAQAF